MMKTLLRHIVTKLVVQSVLTLCTTFLCIGQIKIPNPSFEFKDTLIQNFIPAPWVICKYTPDLLHYSPPNNLPNAQNGFNYIALGCDNTLNQAEEIGINLNCGIICGVKYNLSVSIMTQNTYVNDWSSLLIFGSNILCGKQQLLWQSPFVDTIWQNYNFTFITNNTFQYLTFSCIAQKNFSYLFLDNLSDILIDSGYTAIKAQSDVSSIINGECAILSNNYLIGNQTEYKVQWQQNGSTIGNDYTLSVCPSTTTTYYVKATDSCGYYGTDSIVINVTPNNKAYYNAATGKLQLQYSLEEKTVFKLYNIIGQTENETEIDFTLHQTEINLATLASGIYIACFKNEKGKTIWMQKIFIYN